MSVLVQPFDLQEFLLRAKIALENEDRVLMGAHLARGEHGGLLRLTNERYYQFIVWRAIVPVWKARVECDRHDLVVFDVNGAYSAVFEMKLWMSTNGLQELAGIRSDIVKLNARESPCRCIMLFSANPPGKHIEQAEWLEDRLRLSELSPEGRLTAAFATKNELGGDSEFWLGIWKLRTFAPIVSPDLPNAE